MPDITTSIPSPALGPSADIVVVLGGTTAPYLAHRFRSGHIPSSTPFAEDFHSFLLVLTLVFTLTGAVVDTSFECSFHDQSSLYPIVWILY